MMSASWLLWVGCIQDALWPGTSHAKNGLAQHRPLIRVTDGQLSSVSAQRVTSAWPSKADIAPCHFEECHIADRRTGLGFEDVGQIEQIVIAEACNTRLDLVKAFDRGNTAIVIRLIFVLSMRTPTMSILER
jgi:hypothetical protein